MSRRTLIVGGTSAIVGAGVGAGVAGLANDDVCYQDGGNSYVRGYSGWAQKRWLEQELDRENPCGFVAFDVDPGQPGGNTSMSATYYAVNGAFGEATPVDKFMLTRPRRGLSSSPRADAKVPDTPRIWGHLRLLALRN